MPSRKKITKANDAATTTATATATTVNASTTTASTTIDPPVIATTDAPTTGPIDPIQMTVVVEEEVQVQVQVQEKQMDSTTTTTTKKKRASGGKRKSNDETTTAITEVTSSSISTSTQTKPKKARASKIIAATGTGTGTGTSSSTSGLQKTNPFSAAFSSSSPSSSNVIMHLKCNTQDLLEYNHRLHSVLSTPLDYDPSIPPEVSSYEEDPSFSTLHSISTIGQQLLDGTAAIFQNRDDPLPATNLLFPTSSSSAVLSSNNKNNNNNNNKNNAPMTATTTVGVNILSRTAATPLHEMEMQSVTTTTTTTNTTVCTPETSLSTLERQVRQLRAQLHKNALEEDRRSNCFFDTCEFDGPCCRIPMYVLDDVIHGYGCFCSPQCAVAYLFKENLDDSTKFERYCLLNQIYGDVFQSKGNICPAPDPHYSLDKFYGNMTIKQYRELFKTNHLLITIQKPMTRVLPEIHEETDETILNTFGISKSSSSLATGMYRVKRQSEKQSGPSKTSIVRETFGLK